MITKSSYVSFCKCPVRYYFDKYHPEFATPPSEFDIRIMNNGNIFGDLARSYFGDHITIEYNKNVSLMVEATKKAMNDGYKVICEASFLYEDLFCAVDVLKINDDGSMEIYEVKSSSDPKDYQNWDAAFQEYVLKKLGFNVISTHLMIKNRDYLFDGTLDLHKYMKVVDIERTLDIKQNIDDIHSLKNQPKIHFNKKCDGCPYFAHCMGEVLPEQNVFNLGYLTKPFEKIDEGIVTYNDYLDSSYATKPSVNKNGELTLNGRIKEQIDFELNDLDIKFDTKKVKKFLDKLEYPLYYLDFETITDTVPFIIGPSLNYNRPIQYSLHYDEYKGGPRHHTDYLLDEKKDNLEEIADKLISDLGTSGTILAYHKSVERGIILDLAKYVPSKAKALTAIANRIEDLETPFVKHYIYCKDMHGSSSIKHVLPAFVGGEDLYKKLPLVHNGTEAMAYFDKLMEKDNIDHDKIRQGLLDYCEQDTYSMVLILDKIYELYEERKDEIE